MEQARRQDDANLQQRAGLFNFQYESEKRNQRDMARQAYKEELDAQVKSKKIMNSLGNMTNVEKEMNKDDLFAYKKNDTNQYSLIPGVSTIKRIPAEPHPKKHTLSPATRTSKAPGAALVNEDKLRVQQERLAAYGLISSNISPNPRHGDKTKQ